MKDHETEQAKTSRFGNIKFGSWLPYIIVLVIASCLSFYGGVAYQNHRQSGKSLTQPNGQSTLNNGGNGTLGPGSRRFGRRGAIGTVTAVSPTSITVQNTRTNASQTFAITSDTKVTNNGQSASISDIKTGDTVLVTPSTSNSSQAAQIILNPQTPFGGNSNMPSQPTSNSSI